MAPRESDPLILSESSPSKQDADTFQTDLEPLPGDSTLTDRLTKKWKRIRKKLSLESVMKVLGSLVILLLMWHFLKQAYLGAPLTSFTGPYQLVERQVGHDFFKYYDFFDGPDSIGSAGYQIYVGEARAQEMGLVNASDRTAWVQAKYSPDNRTGGPLESIRLEGKRRFDRGLFILDVEHMPAGCGVWPAFWMTDEENWPDNGEIDIVEGINTQDVVKTALHTSDKCSMFAHVPDYAKTGIWDTATGLPDTFTGIPNFNTTVEADNCWVMAPHQWANQGCVAVSTDEGSIGASMNEQGGGVYALEWDPANGYIKSWVFPRPQIPDNLLDAMETANDSGSKKKMKHQSMTLPEPEDWPLPYAYFAIGEATGCSSDHFQQMRLVLNIALCGTVAGNRFAKDCPALNKKFDQDGDAVATCNAYVASQPDEVIEEAYWKISGVYVYQRTQE